MLKKDLIEKIKGLKDDEDINTLLVGTDVETQFKGEEPTLDTFKQKAKTDKDFKAYIESENDKYHNKALTTWKENNLEKELEPFITAKYPELVQTNPMQKQLLEVQKELAAAKTESAREKLLSQAIKYATEKKLPSGFVDKFLGEDLDTTKANLDVLAIDWSKGLETSMNERLKAGSYVPGGTDKDGGKVSIGASMAQKNNSAKVPVNNLWGK
ncbi:DUF4355 domain-containing protein [Clostridium estertheticum]|uniref:DUF4355 domain-containing protein n=1 Tax=Clostridium estertheticum TaxID=238834 RepID=UPI001CF22210|nr:DUF4355 domain-containing protein [Clostridium estertheticum]MCB2308831.1 DUF4355 domain-containing protein [Clostridium estertheticum]MCB2347319.1 DUF4355 domain-containing protein [Clostridium estertheticum]MCB2351915.1 DUF4355 domain-containing protein [Clostridium estertheticum]WAG48518.1 DUF4355 domain-containing protein [Clostridium estertheticum]